LAYLWMLIGSLFFAAMALLAESLRDQFTYPWITFVRSGVATVLALSLAVAGGAKLVFLKPATLWARSLSGWASMICGFYALTHFDAAIVLALTNMYPLWVAVLSWPMLGKLPSGSTWAALAVSCIGMWLVYSSSIVVGPSTESVGLNSAENYSPTTAIPAAILAGILSGVALINLHRVKDLDTRSVVTHFSAVAAALSMLVWLVVPVTLPAQRVDASGIVRILCIGVAATIGQLCLTKAFASGPPARVSVVGLSQVAVAVIVKWVIESRIPTWLSCLGMLMVVMSTVWVILSQPSSSPSQKKLVEMDS
jgi:drug/metabolite transporter (DMT)-like permease